MARLAGCILAVLVLLPGGSALTAGPGDDRHDRQERGKPHGDRPGETRQGRDRWKWWLYDRAELGITDRQSAEIDSIFETTMPAQRAKREELERMEAALSTLTTENKADVSAVTQQVERVENLRADINKTRTVMLYRINLLLSPEQRAKVKALIEKRNAERRKDNPDSRRR